VRELFRRDVVQLLNGAGWPLDAHEVRIRRVAEAEVDVEAVLAHDAIAAGDFAHLAERLPMIVARSRTFAPMAARFDRVPISRNLSQ